MQPSFSYDPYSRGGPQLIEDITGPFYFRQVTDVWFRMTDDQQVIKSLPYLKQLNHLKKVEFESIPSDDVIAKLKDVLPGVMLVDGDGNLLP